MNTDTRKPSLWRRLTRWQVVPLLLALTGGLAAGRAAPGVFEEGRMALWPVLGLLLFTTFLHLDLHRWRRSLSDRRFHVGIAALNFLLLPAMAVVLLPLAPDDPAIRLAMLLVLLAPCTDWFLAFNLIGRGNPERATATIPVLLLGQAVAVPVWLALALGASVLAGFGPSRFLAVFVGLFLIPLGLALAARWLTARIRRLTPLVDGFRDMSGPLLLPVVFLVAAMELQPLLGTRLMNLLPLAPLFVGWAFLAVVIAMLLGRLTDLAVPARRTLVFSAASRNSFVVMPFALALPVNADLATGVIMLQALIELTLLILLTGLVPRLIR